MVPLDTLKPSDFRLLPLMDFLIRSFIASRRSMFFLVFFIVFRGKLSEAGIYSDDQNYLFRRSLTFVVMFRVCFDYIPLG
jgi:hypothetical protein